MAGRGVFIAPRPACFSASAAPFRWRRAANGGIEFGLDIETSGRIRHANEHAHFRRQRKRLRNATADWRRNRVFRQWVIYRPNGLVF
jgi:hypothetical protein